MPDPITTDSTTALLAADDADDLRRRHRENLFPSVGLFYDEPIELRRGERQYVYDGAGRQYLDFFGGIATVATSDPIGNRFLPP